MPHLHVQEPSAASTVVPLPPPPASLQQSTTAGSVSGDDHPVTMNMGVEIIGQSLVPFNAQAQFAAASSMAAVFSIIIGTGAVQILNFTEVISWATALFGSLFGS